MTAVYLGVALIGFLAFLTWEPKVKALVSFVLMMQFFDAAPNLLFGMYVWDYGAILMLITAIELFFRTPVQEPVKHGYLVALRIFLAWMTVCFLWSLLVYRYDVVHTIKNARYMVLGYFMTLVFIRLFAVQPGSFEFLMKWIYRLTFVLMPVVVLQFLARKQLLFGLVSEYEGALRDVPVFLPFCLLNFWIIGTKLLSSERLAAHEYVYASLVLATVALTFTRGIYIAVVFTAGLLVWTMFWNKTLKASSLVMVAGCAMLLLVGVVASGAAQRVAGRALSGLQLLSPPDSSIPGSRKDDTFNGRLGLAAERFSLVWERNPLIGYGFIHEDDVPSELRNSLKFGTALGGTAADPTAYSRSYAYSGNYVLGFYTADIAWADIVISTGWIGVVLLIILLATFASGHYLHGDRAHSMGYAVKTGLFLQIAMMVLLTFDGNNFYTAVHIPALLLAGYSLAGTRSAISRAPEIRARFTNILK
ncbi:MAG: O-antigen ligase family protein [Steroidobacteraceae bacterium]